MADTPRTYPTGVPCWIDLQTPDTRQAASFYGALFGWEFENVMPPDADEVYLIATLNGQDAAAIAPGDKAQWISYIACESVDDQVEAVRAAGGVITDPPADAGPGGRLAGCEDPQGAVFRLWQARKRLGAQIVNDPGAWNFSDLHTPDATAALDFYGTVFGWQVSDDLGAGMIRLPGYGAHLASGADPDIHERQEFAPEGFDDVIAGLSPSEGRASWEIRFTVADRDETIETATALGATLVSTAETQWTREAVIVDPSGAQFIVSQLVMPD